MATIQARFALNLNTVDFYQVSSHAYATNFYDNANSTFNGVVYKDVLAIQWDDGDDYLSVLGGVDFARNSSGALTGGTVTGYFVETWDNGSAAPVWSIQGIAVPAPLLYQAFQTPGTSDDMAILEAALAGADVIRGSAFADVLNGFSGSDDINGGAGDDTLDGGEGIDVASYAGAASGVKVSLALAASQDTLGAGFDTLVSIENLKGSSHDDTLTGNGGDNVISGHSGNDVLSGGAGNDTLDGGEGIDTVSYDGAGSRVKVSLALAASQDTLGAGFDTLVSIENLKGSSHDDTLTGNGGDNVISGHSGNDVLSGGAGNDTLDGGEGIDTASFVGAASGVEVGLASTASQNTLSAGSDTLISVEKLEGSSYNDTLTGNSGNNMLFGGAGNDALKGDDGNDRLDGGPGSDTAFYAGAASGVKVSLAITSSQDTGGAGKDTLIGIENLKGGSYDDTLTGNSGSNFLLGGSGNDLLNGGAGNDTLNGGAGADTASYAGAASGVKVSLAFPASQDTLGAGFDTLVSIENLKGSSHEDALTGNGGGNSLSGRTGNDLLNGGGGNDTLDGGEGNDTLDGGADADTASYADAASGVKVSLATTARQNTLGAGNDTLLNIESLGGSSYNDTLTGNGSKNVLTGGAGNDTLDGGADTDTASYAGATIGVRVSLAVAAPQYTIGAGKDTLVGIEGLEGSSHDDTLTGNSGDNVLSGGTGNDLLEGGWGNDGLFGGAGDDLLNGGWHDDTLDGGKGTDTASYAGAASGVTVSLNTTATQDTLGAGNDTLLSVENLKGSSYDDTLTGNNGANVLSGRSGNDILRGGEGNDILDGSKGMDIASYAGAGSGVKVSLAIAASQDTLGAGFDTLVGIEGLEGSSYDDTLTGNGGDNVLIGGDGRDMLSYAGAASGVRISLALAASQDTGGAGNDTLVGFEVLEGSSYDDTLTGSVGANVLSGGDGNDSLNGGDGDDKLDGGAGTDTASYAGAVSGVTVRLTTQNSQNTVGAGNDTLISIANLEGSSYDDTLTGSVSANLLSGGDGNDLLDGGDGADKLEGGAGDDVLNGGAGADKLEGGAGNDVLNGGASGNTLDGGTGNDTLSGFGILYGGADDDIINGGGTLFGDDGNDELKANDNDSALYGGAGNDTLTGGDYQEGGEGDDSLTGPSNLVFEVWSVTLRGGAGSDHLSTALSAGGNAHLYGDEGNDTLSAGGFGQVLLYGGDGNDTLTSSSYEGSTLRGGAGDDHLTGSVHDFSDLYGDEGDDVLIGRSTDTRLFGGDGNDTLTGSEMLYGGSGNDTLNGTGWGTLYGGAGNDTLTGGVGGSSIFVFDTALDLSNIDALLDFSAANDSIHLENNVFGSLTAVGTLAATAFHIGAAAADADDRIIYDSGTGALLYDADGIGGTDAVEFATLSTNLVLTSNDFYVI